MMLDVVHLQLDVMIMEEVSDLGIVDCSFCGSAIIGGGRNAVCALGKYWHPSCFTCNECGIELTTGMSSQTHDT
jgi:hypothetical protein